MSYPFFHADRIVTPTLFLCGEKDFNVPLLNSEQMYQALRSLGRETQLVIYRKSSTRLVSRAMSETVCNGISPGMDDTSSSRRPRKRPPID